VEGCGRRVAYSELLGRLEKPMGRRGDCDVVVLSNIREGAEFSPGAQAITLRYVARGHENYRIAGRGYRLQAGQLMIAPHWHGAEADARGSDRDGAVGLCTRSHASAEELAWAQAPLVMAAECVGVGKILERSAKAFWTAQRDKSEMAKQLVGALKADLPEVGRKVLGQAAAIDCARPATRFEMVRRAHLAQAYLHSTMSRAVDLGELAGAVGVSSFRLLAAFQQCFGETPASYHRKLRLRAAVEEATARGMPIGAICDEFGFAGSSSFSHAHKRAFGYAPVWEKLRAA
jgi:AraC-like DNA-binding protein